MKRNAAVLLCMFLALSFSAYGLFYAKEGKVADRLDQWEKGTTRATQDPS
jgi:hypothetical protein